ncbi:UNVERIFIED_CONTAM: Cysteine-rich PDZ-binding protein [Sesamum latifolium]|uniref:Cysteine-rich PDZ-binding protein n=1 Tax=Sesamum latifolium TaxID=2727402 RepID=A0AAW2WMP0_9LAMI
MVCEKCEKKLSKVIVPDKWKEGAHNTTQGGGRKINENKLLSKKHRCVSLTDGRPMDKLNALSVSSKYIRMENIVTHVLIVKEFVQCAGSKYLTPSFTSKAMYDVCYSPAKTGRSP